MRSTSELEDARHKLARAKKHIYDVQAALERTPPGERYAESTDVDFESVTQSQYIHPIWDDNLTEANCAAGDAVHNLRSALDSLAFALSMKFVPALSDRERKKVAFPIKRSKDAFVQSESEITQRLGTGVYAALVKWKPYDGGNILLWGISYFDNIDKHRQLLSFGHVVSQKFPGSVLGSGAPLGSVALNSPPSVKREPWQPYDKEIKMATAPLAEGWSPPTREQKRYVDLTCGDNEALAAYPVVELLTKMSDLTEQILVEFEQEFFPKT